MSIDGVLGELDRRRVEVWLEDGRLHYCAPVGALTDDLRASVQAHRDDIVAVVALRDHVAPETAGGRKESKESKGVRLASETALLPLLSFLPRETSAETLAIDPPPKDGVTANEIANTDHLADVCVEDEPSTGVGRWYLQNGQLDAELYAAGYRLCRVRGLLTVHCEECLRCSPRAVTVPSPQAGDEHT